MAVEGSLTFCLDESMGRPLADILCRLRAPCAPNIFDMRALGFAGASDEVWLAALPRQGVNVVVTLDSRILKVSVRRDVWRNAGLTLFVMDRKWGDLSLFEQGRRLIWWWPSIADAATAGPQGAAWSVAATLAPNGLQRIFEAEVERSKLGRPP